MSRSNRCNWSSTRRAGLRKRPVPPEQQGAPCLNDEQIRTLAGYGAALENHYKCPQDVEWALDPDGKLLILQSRPLKIQSPKNFCLLKAAPLDRLQADHRQQRNRLPGRGQRTGFSCPVGG